MKQKFFQAISKEHFIRNVAALSSLYLLPMIMVNTGNVAAYLFQLVMGRSLAVTEFGNFNQVFSALQILTAPSLMIPLAVTQAAVPMLGLRGEERQLAGWLFSRAGMAAGAVMVVGVLLAPVLARHFEFEVGTILAAVGMIAFSCLQPIVVGLLQARRKYLAVSILAGGTAVVRLACGVMLVSIFQLGVAGATLSLALPVLLTFLLGLWLLRDLMSAQCAALPFKPGLLMRRAAAGQMASQTLIIIMSTLDVLIAREILSKEAAGFYAAASVISRIALLLPSALTGILFTESVSHTGQDQQAAGRKVLGGLAITAVIALASGLGFVLVGGWVARLLLGSSYGPAGDILRVTGPALALLSMTQAVAMVLAARHSFYYIAILASGSVIFVLLAILIHPDGAGLGLLSLAVNGAILIGCLPGVWRRLSKTVAPLP